MFKYSCRRPRRHPFLHRPLLSRAAHVKYPPPPAHYDQPTSNSKPSHTFRISLTLFIIGATISYNYPLYNLAESFFPLPNDDPISIEKYNEKLQSQLNALPIVSELANDSNFTSHRGWNHLDLSATGLPSFHGTLKAPGGIAIPPLAFHNSKTNQDLVIVHLGRRLSGFPFIVHGGISGMVIEEIFKAALQRDHPNLHYNNIHTKSIQLNYKSPVFVNQFVIISSNQSKIDDSHYTLSGEMKSLDGKTLLKATATLSTDSPSKSNWLW
ncbi:hypothetical protein CANINC_004644 [Pichia inconspicua]|uniref:Thioesterase domain-containing protein n=1 Tax=Pichia inconspicua TaxID=52247 RepID=A0A4T0WVV2_9ASCO|nr:hypothetical protein CANINC_004644 [[Candida] inconspicua]